jgi:hypothetical protein
MASKQSIIRYEHLLDPQRWHDILLSLIVFRLRAPTTTRDKDAIFRRLKCIDAFPTRRAFDVIDESNIIGQPFQDKTFVSELSSRMQMYLTVFGYPLSPPVPYFPAYGEDQRNYRSKSLTLNRSITDGQTGTLTSTISASVSAVSSLKDSQVPPLLMTLPGTGGPWVRSLVEVATGWPTAALQGPSTTASKAGNPIVHGTKAECRPDMAAIFSDDPSSVSNSIFDRKSFSLASRATQSRCAGLKGRPFKKVVLLVRNPFDALVAAYTSQQSRIGYGSNRTFVADESWQKYVRTEVVRFHLYWETFSSIAADSAKALIIKYETLVEQLRAGNTASLRELATFIINTNNIDALTELDQRLRSVLFPEYGGNVPDFDDINNLAFQQNPFDAALKKSISKDLKDYQVLFGYQQAETKYAFLEKKLLVQNPLGSVHNQVWPTLVPSLLDDGDHVLNVHKLALMMRCAQHFSYRTFQLEDEDLQELPLVVPPALLSFAGSGNTWVRLLIEFSTGLYSGSSDPYDRVLKEEFIGEKYCNRRVSVIKAHPPQLQLLPQTSSVGTTTTLHDKLHKQKCMMGNISAFDKYVLLVRDPYMALFAEVNRELTSSHVGTVTTESFLQSNWYTLIISEAREYSVFWTNVISKLIRFQEGGGGEEDPKLVLTRYETLIHPEQRYGELYKVIQFLQSTTRARQATAHSPVSFEKIHCAFVQSDVSTVHRVSSHSVNQKYSSMTAWKLYRNQSLVDEIWDYVKDFALFAGYTKYQPPLLSDSEHRQKRQGKRGGRYSFLFGVK